MNRRKEKNRFGGHSLTGKVHCSIEEEFVSCYKMVFLQVLTFFNYVTEGSEAVPGSTIFGNIATTFFNIKINK